MKCNSDGLKEVTGECNSLLELSREPQALRSMADPHRNFFSRILRPNACLALSPLSSPTKLSVKEISQCLTSYNQYHPHHCPL